VKHSETFHSIQGEGKLVGTPSVFFRTSFCNLRCVWCDTPYTSWEPEDRDMSVAAAAEAILGYDCRHVVITGGEPFIQGRELVDLCERLANAGKHVTIETNATVYEPAPAALISMSPKLSNSTPLGDPWEARHDERRLDVGVIRAFLDGYACQVKFVVDTPGDIAEVLGVQAAADIPSEDVVLMPQGLTSEETRPRMEWLAGECVKHGFRLSPRMHVDIWGSRRGV